MRKKVLLIVFGSNLDVNEFNFESCGKYGTKMMQKSLKIWKVKNFHWLFYEIDLLTLVA